tara:strand:- start:70 stop:468 length:399 start_codon:yes stop_codon:yes gene_type:complete
MTINKLPKIEFISCRPCATPHTQQPMPESNKRKTPSSSASSNPQTSYGLAQSLKVSPAAVKAIMNIDPETVSISNEASLAMAVAVELFTTKLAEEANNCSEFDDRTTITYDDLVSAKNRHSNLSFLDELLPN